MQGSVGFRWVPGSGCVTPGVTQNHVATSRTLPRLKNCPEPSRGTELERAGAPQVARTWVSSFQNETTFFWIENFGIFKKNRDFQNFRRKYFPKNLKIFFQFSKIKFFGWSKKITALKSSELSIQLIICVEIVAQTWFYHPSMKMSPIIEYIPFSFWSQKPVRPGGGNRSKIKI